MERRQIIARYAANQEDQILLTRIVDRLSTAEQRNIPAATSFLTQREQQLAASVLRVSGCASPVFYGGPDEAERRICAFIPDYLEPQAWLTGSDSPICALQACFAEENKLTHRDFLGALMGAGIKRETTGDIYVQEGQCDFLVTREIAPYLLQNLVSAGHAHLRIREIPLNCVQKPEPVKTLQKSTVSALRLDSVASACFRISRSRACDLIESGKLSLNFLACTKPDAQLKQGDQIAVRGMGKCRLASVDGPTRKGRISITIEKYT